MSNSSGRNDGTIMGLVFLGMILLLIGIIIPFSADWRWALSLIGIATLLLLVSGATWRGSWIVGLICLLLALVAGGFALSFLSKAIQT